MFARITSLLPEFSFFKSRSIDCDKFLNMQEITNLILQEDRSHPEIFHLAEQSKILLRFLITKSLIEAYGTNERKISGCRTGAELLSKELTENPKSADNTNHIINKIYNSPSYGGINIPSLSDFGRMYSQWLLYLFSNNTDTLTTCCSYMQMMMIREMEITDYRMIFLPAEEREHLRNNMKEMLFLSTLIAVEKLDLNNLFDFILKRNPGLSTYELELNHTTPLNTAITLPNPTMVDTLLKHGSDVNKINLNSPLVDPDYALIPQPLAAAIDLLLFQDITKDKYSLVETIIKSLLANGADPNLMGVRGTPKAMCERAYNNVDDEVKNIFNLVINHVMPGQTLAARI